MEEVGPASHPGQVRGGVAARGTEGAALRMGAEKLFPGDPGRMVTAQSSCVSAPHWPGLRWNSVGLISSICAVLGRPPPLDCCRRFRT